MLILFVFKYFYNWYLWIVIFFRNKLIVLLLVKTVMTSCIGYGKHSILLLILQFKGVHILIKKIIFTRLISAYTSQHLILGKTCLAEH